MLEKEWPASGSRVNPILNRHVYPNPHLSGMVYENSRVTQ